MPPKLLNLPPVSRERAAEARRCVEVLQAFQGRFGEAPQQTMQQSFDDFIRSVRHALETGDPTGVRVRVPGIFAD